MRARRENWTRKYNASHFPIGVAVLAQRFLLRQRVLHFPLSALSRGR